MQDLQATLEISAARLDDVSLRLWLRNPRAIKGNTAMPNFRMSDSEIEANDYSSNESGYLPAITSSLRKLTTPGRFNCRASTVARPVGVKPMINV